MKAPIGTDQLKGFGPLHRIAAERLTVLGQPFVATGTGCWPFAGCFRTDVFEEIRDRTIENAGDVEQTTRTDSIVPALVFLDLLERYSDIAGQLFLADMKERTSQLDPFADMYVNRIRTAATRPGLLAFRA